MMRRLRFSLFSKIIVWFFLNLLLLAAILFFLLNFRFDSRTRFFSSANRIEAVTRQVEDEINQKSRAERDQILKRYSDSYAVEFFAFDRAGRQLGGRETILPNEILTEITRPEPPPPGTNAPNLRLPPNRPPSAFLRTANPNNYWFVGRIMVSDPNASDSIRARLVVVSDSFTGHGLFFDPTPYIVVAAVIIGFSILFWLPFVRNLTGSIGQMTSAAEQIAEERFDVRISARRTDELGRLGTAINHLAERLSGFVTGQKRFLGDVSHELNSPLARMQFALSILEDRVDAANRVYVEDVREEVELMSKLVGELLEFSKAGIKGAQEVSLESVRLRPLVQAVVAREAENARVKLEIDENLKVFAQPELLSRALSNVVRNAVRYAGNRGEIEVAAKNGAGTVQITVADNGAGVPAASLEKLFDPFYRVETDRARATGGTGLGLAIVKTCVEACRGKVFARNRATGGLEIVIQLPVQN